MNKIINHLILPSGLHVLQMEQEGTNAVRVEILTEEEYEHLTWWHKVLIKYNLR
jgi:hypothetical protein